MSYYKKDFMIYVYMQYALQYTYIKQSSCIHYLMQVNVK